MACEQIEMSLYFDAEEEIRRRLPQWRFYEMHSPHVNFISGGLSVPMKCIISARRVKL